MKLNAVTLKAIVEASTSNVAIYMKSGAFFYIDKVLEDKGEFILVERLLPTRSLLIRPSEVESIEYSDV